jgi:hypothetical protein
MRVISACALIALVSASWSAEADVGCRKQLIRQVFSMVRSGQYGTRGQFRNPRVLAGDFSERVVYISAQIVPDQPPERLRRRSARNQGLACFSAPKSRCLSRRLTGRQMDAFWC